jgi:hypothetical protein
MNKKDITPNTFPNHKVSVLDGLPEYLKEPKNYNKIKKALLETLATKCSHAEVIEMAECVKCTEKMMERRTMIKKLGFKSMPQYMQWQRTHEEVKKRVPMHYYDD